MRSFFLGATLSAVVVAVAGCAAIDTSSGGSSSQDISADPMTDSVDVQADRLVFSGDLRSVESFNTLVARIGTYDAEYRKAASVAPAMARVSADATDIWVLDNLRTTKQLDPVILVGTRNSKALRADGTVDTSVKNARGYLRRAISVAQSANGETVVMTQPSNLVEAHEELAKMGLFDLQRSNDNGNDDNWSFQKDYPFTLLDLDLNRSLFHKDLPAGLGQVDVGFTESTLKISGDLDAGAAGRWASPRAAHALLTINLDGKLQLTGRFDGGFAASTGDKKLYEKEYSITSVAGHPLAVNFSVVASCDFGANGQALAQVGATVNGSVKAGGTYDRDNGGAETVWQPQWPQFQRIGPSLTSSARVEGTCTLTATALAKVFDEDGPEATASTFVKLEVNADGAASVVGSAGSASGHADAKLTSGVDAKLAGSLQPFGIHLLDIDTQPFHREWVLFDQSVALQH